jgi:FdhD protein
MHFSSISSYPCRTFRADSWHDIADFVPWETRIELVWPGNKTTLWAFPHDLERLVLGHARVEWSAPDQIPVIDRVEEKTYFLKPCQREQFGTRTGFPAIPPEDILSAMHRFFSRAGMWAQTGCFHRMALLDPTKKQIVHFVEDIARHNCVDRLAGWAVQEDVSPNAMVLLCSSRVTGSLMRKINRLGLPVVVSRSATTMAAIEQAKEHGTTLIGFSRETRFTVFCDPHAHIRC